MSISTLVSDKFLCTRSSACTGIYVPIARYLISLNKDSAVLCVESTTHWIMLL